MYLSKSLYTRGLQCVKSLWIKRYKKDVLTSPNSSAQAIFDTGNEVGELACELFPNGVEIEFDPNDYDGMIDTTKQLIKNGVQNIYEASFNYCGIFVAVDILHTNDDNSVEIYEVKSSTSIKDIYKHDASIQYYVLKSLGYNVKKVSIVHINNNYVRDEELEINKLFTIVDVTDEVLQLQDEIPTHIKKFYKALSYIDREPKQDIGIHCSKPYDCDAFSYCWKHIPKYSIFDISRLRDKKKFELYNQGIINFTDIEDISTFSTAQQIQIESELSQKEIINKDAIKEFVDSLSYPIYHLDFETFQQAVPQWKGISPFMQIPFQYSIHKQEKDGSLKHFEFLADENSDPRYELAKKLVEDIPKDVTVLAYNMGFEKGVIRKLASEFEEFSDHLMAIHENIQDLMIPFAKKHYYTPAMSGSYSIKYVLPALVPDMAKAYKDLDLVQNGGDAMQTFGKLSKMEDKDREAYREALLEYCKLDTLAMVRVLDKLKEKTNKGYVYFCNNCEHEFVFHEKLNELQCDNYSDMILKI